MAWCPICKTEYTKGISICPDCGSPLIEEQSKETEEKELVELYLGSQEIAVRLVEYLKYSKIDSACLGETEVVENPENEGEELEVYKVLVEKRQLKEAEKLAKLFVRNETSENREEEKKAKTFSKPYVKKAEQYEDLISSAITFLGIGAGGILLLILERLGIFSFLFGSAELLIYSVMLAMFLIFCGIGIATLNSAKKVKLQIAEEEQQTKKIVDWFLGEYSREQIDELSGASNETEELKYFSRNQFMKKAIATQLTKAEESYVEALAETLYETLYE